MAVPRNVRTPKSVTTAFGEGLAAIEAETRNDKAELIGVPFIIREVWLTVNKDDVEYLHMYVETQDDGFKTIMDSSTTGVKFQVLQKLTELGVVPEDFTDQSERVKVELFCPRGLRKSTYDAYDNRGKKKVATTHYVA